MNAVIYFLRTIPTFVYFVPVIMLFNGRLISSTDQRQEVFCSWPSSSARELFRSESGGELAGALRKQNGKS